MQYSVHREAEMNIETSSFQIELYDEFLQTCHCDTTLTGNTHKRVEMIVTCLMAKKVNPFQTRPGLFLFLSNICFVNLFLSANFILPPLLKLKFKFCFAVENSFEDIFYFHVEVSCRLRMNFAVSLNIISHRVCQIYFISKDPKYKEYYKTTILLKPI